MILRALYPLVMLLTMGGAMVISNLIETNSRQLVIRSTDWAKEDFEGPAETNWPSLLHPAPKIMAVLAQIMIIAGNATDFALVDKDEAAKIKFITNPKSFYQTMSQLVNQAADAFIVAHANMVRISDTLKDVPDNVDKIIISLQKLPAAFISNFIRIPRDSINTTSRLCVELSTATKEKFQSVLHLIYEIIEVGRAKQGKSTQEKAAKEIESNLTQQDFDDAKAQGLKYEKMVNESRAESEDARKACEKAIESMPDTWTLLGQDVLRAFANTMMNVGQTLVTAYSGKMLGNAIVGAEQALLKKPEQSNQNQPAQKERSQDSSPAIKQAPATDPTFGEVLNECNELLTQVAQIPIENQTLSKPSDDKIKAAKGMIRESRGIFSRCRNTLNKFPESATKDQGVQLVTQADTMLQNFPDVPADQFKILQDRVDKKSQEITNLLAKVAFRSDEQVSKPDVPPTATREQIRVKYAQDRLQTSERRYEENLEIQRENDRKLSNLTHNIAKLSFTINQLASIIEVLKTCLDHISDLQIHWTKLVDFFIRINSRIQSKLGENQMVDNFVKLSKVIETSVVQESLAPTKRDIFLQMILADQKKTKTNVEYLYVMTNSYAQVSEQYLLPRVTRLNKFFGSGKPEILLQALADQSDKDVKGIDEIIDQQLKEYNNRVGQANESLKIEDKSSPI